MGMVGAGLATIIGQIFAAFLVLRYLLKYKTGKKVYNIKVTEKGKNISINVIGD